MFDRDDRKVFAARAESERCNTMVVHHMSSSVPAEIFRMVAVPLFLLVARSIESALKAKALIVRSVATGAASVLAPGIRRKRPIN
jgi:hypothetical protein